MTRNISLKMLIAGATVALVSACETQPEEQAVVTTTGVSPQEMEASISRAEQAAERAAAAAARAEAAAQQAATAAERGERMFQRTMRK